jgi:uncharacterized surface protein with fasciclin (FAS1) repeats
MRNRWLVLSVPVLLSLSAAVVATGCGGEEPPPQAPEPVATADMPPPPAAKQDIVDTAVAAGKFNTLAQALTKAGLVDTLKGPGPYTVFAPTDEAFAKLPKEQLDAVLGDKDKLTALLTYHVVPGSVKASDVVKMTSAKTVNGKDLAIKVDGSMVRINGASVTSTDLEASNGVIHVVDTVLMPEEPKPAVPDLVQTAMDAKSFTTLTDLLTKAGLVDTLKGPGPFTVFAPTDDAFKKVPKKTMDELGKDTEKLKGVLTYHVVEGKVLAADVGAMKTAKTVQGGEIKIKADAKGVTLDGKTKVVKTDIVAGNGVIHVIDSVLMPPKAPAGAKAAAKPAGTGGGDHHGGGGGKGTGGGAGGKK